MICSLLFIGVQVLDCSTQVYGQVNQVPGQGHMLIEYDQKWTSLAANVKEWTLVSKVEVCMKPSIIASIGLWFCWLTCNQSQPFVHFVINFRILNPQIATIKVHCL